MGMEMIFVYMVALPVMAAAAVLLVGLYLLTYVLQEAIYLWKSRKNGTVTDGAIERLLEHMILKPSATAARGAPGIGRR